jgi:glycyl-tRNA synthetase beta chain
VEIPAPSEYLEVLREAKVEASPGERRDRILAEVRRVEEDHQVQAALASELLGRIVGGAEWPVGVLGTIPEEFLELPAPMIEATLAAEGKFVPFSRDGEPAEVFLGFRDGAPDELGVVRQGYERVVRARLRDSRFFFRNDRRLSLADRVRLLRGVVYEGRLGTVRERVERIRAICSHLAQALDLPAELLDRAAFLAKADLTTEVVREFPELEGVMGGIYASLDGEPPEVAQAIREHPKPQGPNSALPKTKLGAALSLADKLDAVVGAIRVGEVPTGSHDPYGIRRRGAAVVRLVLELGLSVDLFAIIDATADLYPLALEIGPSDFIPEAREMGPKEAYEMDYSAGVKAFLLDRLRAALLSDFRYDVVDAVLAVPRGDFLGARARAEALTRLRDEGLADLVLAFGRVHNITQGYPGAEFDPELFGEEAERELWRAYLRAEGHVREALARGDYEGALRSLRELRGPIDRYFDLVLVMTDDPRLRQNRLGFLGAVRGLFLLVGDLSRLVMS